MNSQDYIAGQNNGLIIGMTMGLNIEEGGHIILDQRLSPVPINL